MHKKLKQIEERVKEIEGLISEPAVLQDTKRFQELAKELANLRPVADAFGKLCKIEAELKDANDLLNDKPQDEDLKALYEDERAKLEADRKKQQEALENLLLDSEDPDKDKNVIMEIRAGTGGEEAALFAADLFRLYSRYAGEHSFRVDVLSTSQTGLKGLKEIIFSISGEGAHKKLRYESGTHRVQRVPQTETSGRIHTSAVTVAVMPEAGEVDLEVDPNDLRIDVYRSSGPGGQSVNTTDSAVRITHLPTNTVVQCQDEKSQHKNKAKAMRILRTRILDKMKQDQHNELSAQRKVQVGSGDRSQKIRTYNYPDRRVTDHRINLTLYALDEIMEGGLDPFLEALEKEERMKLLTAKTKED